MKISVLMPYFNRLGHLKNTLETYEHFYRGRDLEIIIVDDGSAPRESPEQFLFELGLDYKYLKIAPSQKRGPNPCLPYNIAARYASGEIFLLTSPEIMHTKSIFEAVDALGSMGCDDYLVLSVANAAGPEIFKIYPVEKRIDYVKENYLSGPIQWYQHGRHNNTMLHFCSLICREAFFKMRGFDERYREGSCYDDNEFLRRLLEEHHLRVSLYDNFEALHIPHPVAPGNADFALIERNRSLYMRDISRGQFHTNGDDWGALPR